MVIPTRRRIEFAKLATDWVCISIKSNRRASRGQRWLVALKIRVALLGNCIEHSVAIFFGEQVFKAVACRMVYIIHADRDDRLDAPIKLRCTDRKTTATTHTNYPNFISIYKWTRT